MIQEDSCETITPGSGSTYPDVPESNPSETFTGNTVLPVEPDPAETAANISTLAETIRAALVTRSLPIRIKQGEVITDLELFAHAQARAIVTGSPNIDELARDRLKLLGIDTTPLL